MASSASERTQTTTAARSDTTSHPMLQMTPSRKLGSRPRAKKCRSTQRKKTVAPARTSHGTGPLKKAIGGVTSDEEEGEAEDQVHGEQLETLEPRRLALLRDLEGDQDGEHHRAELEPVEDERHRELADEQREQD